MSRYFKSTDSFQPEDIFKKKQQDNSGWKSSVKDVRSSPFQAAEPIESAKHAPLISPSSPDTVESQSDQAVLADSADTDQPQENEAQDLPEYIEVSVAEKENREAYDAGVQSGLEKAENDFGSATNSLLTMCQQLDTIRETIIANSSREMQDFALAIAERIVRSTIQDNDSTIIATIDEALQRSVKSDEFNIYIHPDDYDIVLEKSAELIAGLRGLNNIVIKKDVTIEKGGAKIESDNCTIDATIASQFDVIHEEMKKRL